MVYGIFLPPLPCFAVSISKVGNILVQICAGASWIWMPWWMGSKKLLDDKETHGKTQKCMGKLVKDHLHRGKDDGWYGQKNVISAARTGFVLGIRIATVCVDDYATYKQLVHPLRAMVPVGGLIHQGSPSSF